MEPMKTEQISCAYSVYLLNILHETSTYKNLKYLRVDRYGMNTNYNIFYVLVTGIHTTLIDCLFSFLASFTYLIA